MYLLIIDTMHIYMLIPGRVGGAIPHHSPRDLDQADYGRRSLANVPRSLDRS